MLWKHTSHVTEGRQAVTLSPPFESVPVHVRTPCSYGALAPTARSFLIQRGAAVASPAVSPVALIERSTCHGGPAPRRLGRGWRDNRHYCASHADARWRGHGPCRVGWQIRVAARDGGRLLCAGAGLADGAVAAPRLRVPARALLRGPPPPGSPPSLALLCAVHLPGLRGAHRVWPRARLLRQADGPLALLWCK